MHHPATFLRFLGVAIVLLMLGSPGLGRASTLDAKIGFGGCWKLGHWTPIVVSHEAETGPDTRLQVVAPDNDGAPMIVEALAAGRRVPVLTRIGRIAPLTIRLTDGERVLEKLLIEPSSFGDSPSRALAATDTLVACVGAGGGDFSGVLGAGTVVARVDSPLDLPVDWAGYESVDLLIVEATNAAAWRAEQAAGTVLKEPTEALTRWVESGGRLMLVLGDKAETLVGREGPLADLLPGRFRRVVTLPAANALERYADAERPLDGPLRVAQIEETQGVIEAHGPGRATDLPLVVRTARGLGEVLTVTFDLNTPELSSWPARRRLLQKITRSAENTSNKNDSALGGRLVQTSKDLATALRSRLGQQFAGVRVTPLLAIVAGVVLYLLLIGPADYFLVGRALKRPALTWVTFPLMAVGAIGVVMAIGAGGRSGGLRINQIELTDVDTITGSAHCRLWAELYSPRAERRSIALAPRGPSGNRLTKDAVDTRLGWFGAPGSGLAGMQSTLTAAGDSAGYWQWGDRLEGLPINTASTKSLAASWVASLPQTVKAKLSPDGNGLVEGTVTNNTDATLRGARLVFGEWAWRLGTIAAGGRVQVDESLAPVKLTTLLRTDLLGPAAFSTGGGGGRSIDGETLDAAGVLRLMLFHKAVGGRGYSGHKLQYQRSVDLSHQLAVGRAVLIAEADGPRSALINPETGQPLAESPAGESEASTTLYRFILPVGP